jgi:hypothetical protein
MASVLMVSALPALCMADPVTPSIARSLEFTGFTEDNKLLWFDDGFDPPEQGWVVSDKSGAGQYWHLTQRSCVTWWDPPNSYVCDNDPDTTSLPGGLDCWLISPLIDVYGIPSCTVWYAANMHFDYDANTGIRGGSTTSGTYGALYKTYVTLDDGDNWHMLGEYAGDMERHYGDSACWIEGWFRIGGDGEITDLLHQYPSGDMRFAFAVETDPAGAFGCAASGSCWLSIERVFVTTLISAEDDPVDWGRIKSMFQ